MITSGMRNRVARATAMGSSIASLSAVLLLAALPLSAQKSPEGIRTVLRAGALRFEFEPATARYGFASGSNQIVAPSATNGILLAGHPASLRGSLQCNSGRCSGTLATEDPADAATLTLQLSAHRAEIRIVPAREGISVVFETGGASPAFGLGDHAIIRTPYDTDVTGFSDEKYLSGQNITRLESNFLIYPTRGFATVLIDPSMKDVQTSADRIVQGVVHAHRSVTVHYFFGTPREIYKEFLQVRRASGYPVFAPKPALFGVGWEAFGALGWETNHTTVQQNIERYLREGYPLRWAVIGSGFWPAEKRFNETTSFGLFDPIKYPHPRALIAKLHKDGLKVLFGLRITFITDGPYSAEGVEKGYFIKANGKPEVFTGNWPKSPYYLLDAHNPDALNWYLSLLKKWTDYGVDGFKEDFYDFGRYGLRDDKVDPVNNRLMQQGVYVIERNGYLSSNGDLHRINDFNFDQDQDRGPVNALALAYAGLPLVYPDIVGGTFGENRFDTTPTPRMEQYMMRNARWASLHSSMSMGQPPWQFPSRQTREVMLASALFHDRISPYLYSQGRRFAEDGFPWTMVPLPLAFPNDSAIYAHDNERVHGYEWMIGDALLAAPIYGDNYETAKTRDIYLPAGKWMDYDTGRIYDGNQTLKDFSMPVTKTPVFIGGSGLLLEREGADTIACLYPISKRAATVVWLEHSQNATGIRADIRDWSKAQVVDTSTGKEVSSRWSGRALRWQVEANHSYLVH